MEKPPSQGNRQSLRDGGGGGHTENWPRKQRNEAWRELMAKSHGGGKGGFHI